MSSDAEYRSRNTRQASALKVGGFRPSLDPLASNFCRAPVALPGEQWPTCDSGPLAFVCQYNIATAPAVPDLLADVRLITFFVHPDPATLGKTNGENWCLRAYSSLEGLVVLAAPAGAPKFGKGFECLWESCEDHPNHDDPELIKVPGVRRPRRNFDNVTRSKIGGYASTIQGEPWWGLEDHPADPRFCLQVNTEEKAGVAWGGGGSVYIARGTAVGTTDQWFLDWQTP